MDNEIGKQIDVLVAEMQGKVIETDEQFQFVGEWLTRNKQTQKIVEDHFAPKKEELYRPYKDLLAEIKGYMDRLQNAERAAKLALGTYQQKKERERQAEIQRQQEAERKRIEDAKLTAAINTGDDSLLDLDVPAPKITAPAATPKVSGVSFRETWAFEITDPNAIPREYLMPDMQKIRAAVMENKEKTAIPGIKPVKQTSVAAGGR